MLGSTLKAAREARGLSLGALAKKTRIAKSTLSRWENEQSIPYPDVLMQVLDVLAVPHEVRRKCLQQFDVPRTLHYLQTSTSAALSHLTGGELLKTLRTRSGKTQVEVARALGATQGQISKWENDEQIPDSQQLHQFCYATGATQNELIGLCQRDWLAFDPLPSDKEALDEYLLELDRHDTLIERDLVYLALATRYARLYRANQISKTQALGIWGTYAHYVGFQHRFTEGAQLASYCLAEATTYSHRLEYGSVCALVALNTYLAESHQFGKVLEQTSSLKHLVPKELRFFWFGSAAVLPCDRRYADQVLELWKTTISVAHSPWQYHYGQQRFARALCAFEHFAEAQSIIENVSNTDSRVSVQAERELISAWALIGQGAVKAAEPHLRAADSLLQDHAFPDLHALANQLRPAKSSLYFCGFSFSDFFLFG